MSRLCRRTWGALLVLGLAACEQTASVGTIRDEDPPAGDPPPVGVTAWAHNYGGLGSEQARDLAIDPSGDIIVAGALSSQRLDSGWTPLAPVSLGGDPLSSPGITAAFVARYSVDGDHIWSRAFTGTGGAENRSVALAPDGDIVVAGGWNGAIDFGLGTLTVDEWGDAYVVKLSADGTPRWVRRIEAPMQEEYVADLAVDAGGNVIAVGRMGENDITLPTGVLESSGGGDGFIVKLSPLGEILWAERLGGAGSDAALYVATDPAGDIYVAGGMEGAADFGPDHVPFGGPGFGQSDSVVVKLAASGELLWAHRGGGEASDAPRGLGVDGDAVFLAAGMNGIQNDMSFDDGGFLDSNWGHGVTVVRYTLDGVREWAVDLYPTNNGTCGFSAAGGRLYLTTRGIESSPFLGVLDAASGVMLARTLYPAPTDAWGMAIASDAQGAIVFAGTHESMNGEALDLGTGPLPSNGAFDLYLARVLPPSSGE